jgi:hypothetical protein
MVSFKTKLAEFSKESYGLKRAVLLKMMIFHLPGKHKAMCKLNASLCIE